MTYNETAAIVYRVVSAYPFYARNISDEMLKNMVREWHEGLANVDRKGAMEAVTALITDQKWMPTLSEVIGKILDVQYGTEDDIIRQLDIAILRSSNCIIFGQVTEEQEQGYAKLTPFQKQIIHSPYNFNLWLNKDHEWKAERVRQVKRQIQNGRLLPNNTQRFDVLKALEDR